MNHATPNRSFYTAAVMLLIACFLPGGFASWLGGRLGDLTIPLSAPLVKLSMVVRAVPERMDSEDPAFKALRTRNKEQEARISHLEARAASLHRQLERLQALKVTDPSFRPVTAYRVAESLGRSDLFKVSLGSLSGVRIGSLAYYEGYQLLGRVSAVSPRSATITPITSKDFGPVSALVIAPDGVFEHAMSCTLDPAGDGTLTGEIGKDEASQQSPVSVGQRVVYRDPDLRQLNTGPLIGIIEKVEPNKAPLFVTITVRPEANLDDVSEVDLKLPRAGASGGGDN